jgi:single-strand DNA-binding protein
LSTGAELDLSSGSAMPQGCGSADVAPRFTEERNRMNDTQVTIVGNVVDNPQVRVTGKGTKVASFRVGSTSRRFDKDLGEWVDGQRLFVSVSCWRQFADNVAGSLRRGDPIVVVGRLSMKEYDKDGQRRISFELDANALGHDLARGTTQFSRSRSAPATSFDGLGAEQESESTQRGSLRLVPDLEQEEPALAAAR